MFVPAGAPAAIIDKLNSEIVSAIETHEIVQIEPRPLQCNQRFYSRRKRHDYSHQAPAI
jgi:hypothetical protein